MPSANPRVDGEDIANHSQSRAYSNKSRDHARQTHVEIPGDEPSGASFPILASLIDVARRINHYSETSLVLRLTRPHRHLRTGLQTLDSRRSLFSY